MFKGISRFFRFWRQGKKLKQARVFIVSYPKAGRSLLMTMIGRSLCDLHNLSEYLLGDPFYLTQAAGALPTMCSYDGTSLSEAIPVDRLKPGKSMYKGKKVILVFRDPRDAVISCYRSLARRKRPYKGTLADFIRSNHFGIRKALTFYNQWHKSQDVPEEFMLIRYEEMHKEPKAVLRRALGFLGIDDVDEEIVQNVVRYAQIRHGHRHEKRKAAEDAKGAPKFGDDDTIDLDDWLDPDEDEQAFQPKPRSKRKKADRLRRSDYEYMNKMVREMGCPFLVEGMAQPIASDWT